MKHFYCRYGINKIIKVDWTFIDSDMSRYGIELKFLNRIIDIQALFEEHLSKIKERDFKLLCFLDKNICSLKYNNEVNTAFIYFYDVIEVQFSEDDECYQLVLTIRNVKQGPAGTCCS